MKKLYFSACCLLLASLLFAQAKQHKIVFDFTRADTASFAVMVRHANSIMTRTGNAQLEIVCHGGGLDLVLKEKSTVQKEIKELQEKYNVVFAACEATMKRKGIDKNQLMPQVVIVPAAILEISTREQEGWSYIKE